jgi:hypothetical protein
MDHGGTMPSRRAGVPHRSPREPVRKDAHDRPSRTAPFPGPCSSRRFGGVTRWLCGSRICRSSWSASEALMARIVTAPAQRQAHNVARQHLEPVLRAAQATSWISAAAPASDPGSSKRPAARCSGSSRTRGWRSSPAVAGSRSTLSGADITGVRRPSATWYGLNGPSRVRSRTGGVVGA